MYIVYLFPWQPKTLCFKWKPDRSSYSNNHSTHFLCNQEWRIALHYTTRRLERKQPLWHGEFWFINCFSGVTPTQGQDLPIDCQPQIHLSADRDERSSCQLRVCMVNILNPQPFLILKTELTLLYCITLYCIVLYCIVLYCIGEVVIAAQCTATFLTSIVLPRI